MSLDCVVFFAAFQCATCQNQEMVSHPFVCLDSISKVAYHSVWRCLSDFVPSYPFVPKRLAYLGQSWHVLFFCHPRDGIMLKRHEMGLEGRFEDKPLMQNHVSENNRESIVFGSDFGISVTGNFSGSTCKCSQSLSYKRQPSETWEKLRSFIV